MLSKILPSLALFGLSVAVISKQSFLAQRGSDQEESDGEEVHWVFTTDCSAYMYNQGNLMLASAYEVKQPGQFTWIVYGCSNDAQKQAFLKLAHPDAHVWHMAPINVTDPATGQPYPEFQASNRPVSIAAWYEATRPSADAIGILDPDMTWLRPVVLADLGHSVSRGAWLTHPTAPKVGSGAMYGQGCIPEHFTAEDLDMICGDEYSEKCTAASRNSETCRQSYSSGPPWIFDKADAAELLGTWTDTAGKVHKVWPDMLAEQVSYGVAQMKFDQVALLDTFWFLSDPTDDNQPWKFVRDASYDPCMERAPPRADSDLDMPPIWHACSTYEIPELVGTGFRLHKDHIHKDLLDCDAPLLHYPPREALTWHADKDDMGFRQTWSVCAYTNLVNHYATAWKTKYCEAPNLNATFSYPDHAQSFLNEDSPLAKLFRRGGWTDVDYHL